MEDITKLTVVNECLKCMSEAPLNTLENEDHPYIAAALSALNIALIRELSLPWWFNTEFATLYPDAVTKKISVPQNCLDIDPRTGGGYIVARGRYLYDRYNQTQEFDQEIPVRYTSFVEFDELPILMKVYVMYSAVLDFCKGFDADPQRVQEVSQMYGISRATVKAADTRNKDVNMFEQLGTSTKLNKIAWPGTTATRARNAARR